LGKKAPGKMFYDPEAGASLKTCYGAGAP